MTDLTRFQQQVKCHQFKVFLLIQVTILLVAHIKVVKNKSSYQNISLSIELMCDI